MVVTISIFSLNLNQPSLHQGITFWAVIWVGLILQLLRMEIHLAVNKLPKLEIIMPALRANIQRKATKGTGSTRRRCRELLKRLSGKEKRFQTLVNHTIGHRIITKAQNKNQLVALEDLTGIRARTNQQPRSKKERRLSNSWAFFQLRQFLIYKAIKHSVKILFVEPRYTSQMCHKCNHIHPVKGKSYRNGKKFACGHCGPKGDADLNGSKNIAAIGAFVNKPEGSRLFCNVQDHFRAIESPHCTCTQVSAG